MLGVVLALLHLISLASSSSTSNGARNTLTTSCNGGCSNNSACIIVGQSSINSINCINDINCITLSSGQSARCLDAFTSTATEWVFQPAESHAKAGTGPFERVGLLQLAHHVTDLTFSKAEDQEEPIAGSLELASMNIRPDMTLDKVTFRNLNLSGLDNALPLHNIKRMCVAVRMMQRNLTGSGRSETDVTLHVCMFREQIFQQLLAS